MKRGDKESAIKTLERLIYIYPIGEELHQTLGDSICRKGNPTAPIREFKAVVASNAASIRPAHDTILPAPC